MVPASRYRQVRRVGAVAKIDSTEVAVDTVVKALCDWHRQDTDFPNASGYIPTMSALARTVRQRDEIGRKCAEMGLLSIVLQKDQDAEMRPGVIRLATLHRAKGLEFDRVVILGKPTVLGNAEDTAQERSLLYVALTRARREAALILC